MSSDGEAGSGEIAGGAGVQRPAAGGGGGVDHRADGAAGVGEGELALAVRSSGLGELLEVDFEAMSVMRLYRVSDALMARRASRSTCSSR